MASIADWVQEGLLNKLLYWYSRPVNPSAVEARLLREYPDLDTDTLRNVTLLALQAIDAGEQLTHIQPGQTIPQGLIPHIPGIDPGHTVVHGLVAMVGGEGQTPRFASSHGLIINPVSPEAIIDYLRSTLKHIKEEYIIGGSGEGAEVGMITAAYTGV